MPLKITWIFQFTTSRGGRLIGLFTDMYGMVLSIHDLSGRSTQSHPVMSLNSFFQFTTSRGGRPLLHINYLPVLPFQFTTSRGGRPAILFLPDDLLPFNSRPLGEVDHSRSPLNRLKLHLSIHDLSGRSTGAKDHQSMAEVLSIHDLSGRSTAFNKQADTVSKFFQFTTSRGGRQVLHL